MAHWEGVESYRVFSKGRGILGKVMILLGMVLLLVGVGIWFAWVSVDVVGDLESEGGDVHARIAVLVDEARESQRMSELSGAENGLRQEPAGQRVGLELQIQQLFASGEAQCRELKEDAERYAVCNMEVAEVFYRGVDRVDEQKKNAEDAGAGAEVVAEYHRVHVMFLEQAWEAERRAVEASEDAVRAYYLRGKEEFDAGIDECRLRASGDAFIFEECAIEVWDRAGPARGR